MHLKSNFTDNANKGFTFIFSLSSRIQFYTYNISNLTFYIPHGLIFYYLMAMKQEFIHIHHENDNDLDILLDGHIGVC